MDGLLFNVPLQDNQQSVTILKFPMKLAFIYNNMYLAEININSHGYQVNKKIA